MTQKSVPIDFMIAENMFLIEGVCEQFLAILVDVCYIRHKFFSSKLFFV